MKFYIEVLKWKQIVVTPFGECGLKWDEEGNLRIKKCVTPFGECGLKLADGLRIYRGSAVTPFGECGLKCLKEPVQSTLRKCHSLRGVWIEIILAVTSKKAVSVTPFGECGLKWLQMILMRL